ncbi:Surfeit locus 1 family protein, partial [Pseudomonas sp. GW531-E2]
MRRSPATIAFLLIVAGVLCAALVALGVWQIERRTWKLALIARVEQRIHAPASP